MSRLSCKLFGKPEVLKEDRIIVFPFKKAEALFYYLIMKKQCFRDMLVDVFWGYADEKTAKKNLRNAVYIINKTFGEDILISPQRAIVMLNPNIEYEIDIDVFDKEDDNTGVGIYSGELLEGFYVKDAEGFDKWIFSLREDYRDAYVSKLQKLIQRYMHEKDIDKVESLCKSLIRADEFNEKAYRILMNVYRKLGNYERSIEVYHNLSKLLHSELSIVPDTKTTDLLAKIIKEKAATQALNRSEEDEYFYGRQMELQKLSENYYNFAESKKGQSVLILGEAGLGKSALVSRHLKYINDNKVTILNTNCYQAEENYLLKPWNNILNKLSIIIERDDIEIPAMLQRIVSHVFPAFAIKDEVIAENPIEQIDILKYQVVEKAILDILIKVSEKKMIIFIFEDIHWIDKMSLSLIQQLIFEGRNRNMIFIATSRNGYNNKLENIMVEGKIFGLIDTVELKRFNKKETLEFAFGMAPELITNNNVKESLFRETEGNTFFIVEFLNNLKHSEDISTLTPKMQDILQSRFFNISEEGKKILNITAMFFDKITLEELLKVSNKSEFELMDIISELEEKNLLKEVGETKDVGFVFTHQKLREFVYMNLPLSKKKILHTRIAKLLEAELKGNKKDTLLYSKLIYHYENGGNQFFALKYRIKNLEQYLGINHEMFPIFYNEGISDNGFVKISDEQVKNDLLKVNQLIKEIRTELGNDRELDKLELSLKHMIGRGNIISGDYSCGIAEIKEMIEGAIRIADCNLALKGYRQMIYFGINIYDTKLMEKYIEEAICVAEKCKLKEEICILHRLKGMQRVMDGRFSEGEQQLKYAISEFENLDHREKYVPNIAASYNFIGESKRKCMEFYSSFGYYDKAIAICEQNGLIKGLPIFSTNAGQAAFDIGDYSKAREYLLSAIEAYMQLDSLWGRSTAYGYMALLLVREGKYEEALLHIMKASDFATIIQSPYEKALIYRVKAEIRKMMELDLRLKEIFSSYLSEMVSDYCNEGIELLKRINNCYELKILEDLRDL